VLPQFFARDPNFMRRFQREAKAVAQLSHPNIVPIHNYGEQGEFAYIAMQYVEGGTLKHERDKQLEPVQALRLLLPVIRALDYAHERGIVHRDIKPGNILLNDDGWPLLADFGLARMAEASVKLTGTGVGVGTPMYMSPEQGQGLDVDRRTDIYSLGIVLYELLTGDVPFKADTPMAVVVKHMTAAMPMPREVNPEIPKELEQIILKATAKNPEDRYQTATAMAAALEEALETLTQAPQPAPTIPDSTEASPPSESNFKIKPLYLGILAVLVLVVLVVGFLSGQASNLGVALGLGGTDTPTITQIDATATSLPSSTSAPTSTRLPSSTPTLTATQLPTSTPIPTLGAGSEKISPVDGMTLLYVPAGEFLMGASEDDQSAWEDEVPQHTVYLDPFWIDQTEVTNAMYAAFLTDRGNQREGGAYWLDADSDDVLIVQNGDQWQPKDGYADHPVLEVTWYGARAYCDWAGRRLPSEAEWEKAARGTDGRKRPWGNSMPTSGAEGCKYEWAGGTDCGAMGPIPVGSLPLGTSPYNAMDMGGNVREWVQDLYGENYYAISVLDNPKGPSSGSYRVLRGGGWKYGNAWTRTTKRYSANPITSDNYTGFRCAADVAP
jgi:serine/threonine-protein kinase